MTNELKVGDTKKIPLNLLRFDLQNPRLTPDHRPEVSENPYIIQSLYKYEDLDELITSMASNGYLDFEPLIVMQDPNSTNPDGAGPFIILEGNRRFAATLFLLSPDLGKKLRIPYPESVFSSFKEQVKELRVTRVLDREEARAFIGFKHVNGAQMWDAYPKALYVTDWYLRAKERDSEQTLSHLASQMGDKHDTIKRMVNSNLALMQIEKEGLFTVAEKAKGTKFHFSHFYTAMARKDYCTFAGLKTSWILDDNPSETPLTKNQLPKVVEILKWLYGYKTDDLKPVIRTQNPDVRKLGEVLISAKALPMLRADRDLNAAHEETISIDERFDRELVKTHKAIKACLSNVGNYEKNEGQLQLAVEIQSNANALLKFMKASNT